STWTTINMDSTCINCSRTNSLRSVDPRGPTLYLVRGGTDSDKFLRHQRGASHEAAVDVRLGEKLGRVPRLDAAAIKDGEVFRHFPVAPRDLAANERVHLLGMFGAGGQARSYRPYRLVGDHRVGEGRDAVALENRAQLLQHDGLGLARLVLLERLADAQDRYQAVRLRVREFLRHQLVGFGEDVTPFRMADD